MPLYIKYGVQPSNLIIAAALANIAAELDLTLLITSGTDGQHMAGSKHYTGEALDLRISNLTESDLNRVLIGLQHHLGAGYDIVREADHIHVEHDPH